MREPVLRLSERDLKLMEAVFPARHQVFLLIQRTEAGPANATFFFWDQGRMCGDLPFLEFPFDVSLLAAVEQNRVETLHKKLAARTEIRSPEPAVRQEPRPRRRVTTRALFWSFAAALVVCLCGAAVAVKWLPERYWPRLTQTTPPGASPAPAPREAFFGLHAERQNGDLKLTWNRDASVVLNATSGLLTIEDGGNNRKITLDPMQVRSGSILYAPATDQVQMQLSVLTPQGAVSESVLVILSKAGTPKIQMVAQKVVAASPAVEPQQPLSNPEPAPLKPFTAPTRTEKAPASPAITEPPPAVRSETAGGLPAALNPRLTAAAPPLAVPKTTNTAPSTSTAPPPAPDTTAAPVSNPPAPQPQPAATATDQPVYYGPEVASKVIPPFPSYLKAVVVKPTMIEVKVGIDAKGRVVRAEPVSAEAGPPALVAAATNAARLWRFKAARKGTEPIPSELVLQFLFRPPQ